jgi:hypothetical protein
MIQIMGASERPIFGKKKGFQANPMGSLHQFSYQTKALFRFTHCNSPD